MDNKNVHEGHRGRLKNKFLQNGFEGFEHHNILELLLFYSIPRKDTNEIAHNLLDHFGSLKNVFNADFDSLLSVKGISENSATLIKMIPKIAQEYMSDCLKEGKIFDSAEKIGEFFVNKYLGEKNEIVYAMLLSNGFELISVVKIHEGTINTANAPSRKIVDAVIKQHASMVVLAHNHPGGNICPSVEDMNTTAELMSLFESLEIKLLEHFIISGNEYSPIIHNTPSLRIRVSEKKPSFKSSVTLKF